MAKRLREEDTNRNKPGFFGFATMSISAAFSCIATTLGFSGPTPSDIGSMKNQVTIEQTQSIINENKQQNESLSRSTRSHPKFFSGANSKKPIRLIRTLKAHNDENNFLGRTVYSSNIGEGENFGTPTSSRSERKTPDSSNYSIHYADKEPLFTPYKACDYSGESSTKILTPRKSDSLSEEEIRVNHHTNLIQSGPNPLNSLREMVALYNSKNNSLIEARKERGIEVARRLERKYLTPEQEATVRKYYKDKDFDKILVKINNIDIKYEDLERIAPGQWLNDELINCYMCIINDESKKNKHYPRVHCFNTFFYVMLLNSGKGYSYQRVAKWTKSFDVFALDFVIIPIHVGGNHWCLSVINFRDKRVEYYDSMGGTGASCIKNLRLYIADEYLAKKGTDLDMSDWVTYTPGNTIPQQHNIYDCGVFMCQFAESICSGNEIQFVSQADMPYYRKRMMLEILNNNRHFDKVDKV